MISSIHFHNVDQSQVFIDKYNTIQKNAAVKDIKSRIEAMSIDNPFMYLKSAEAQGALSSGALTMQRPNH